MLSFDSLRAARGLGEGRLADTPRLLVGVALLSNLLVVFLSQLLKFVMHVVGFKHAFHIVVAPQMQVSILGHMPLHTLGKIYSSGVVSGVGAIISMVAGMDRLSQRFY